MQSRKSKMLLNEVYFWTDTIKDWNHLLKPEKYKGLIIQILEDLCKKNLIRVFGFVIMPNHLHFLWEHLKKNGREMPYASFNKAIGHLIIKDLKMHHVNVLPYFKVDEREREYRVWQRDALAVLMDSKKKFEQKLEYIHLNPLQEKWNLSTKPEGYRWSSAAFYEYGFSEFEFLTDYREVYG